MAIRVYLNRTKKSNYFTFQPHNQSLLHIRFPDDSSNSLHNNVLTEEGQHTFTAKIASLKMNSNYLVELKYIIQLKI